MNRPFLLDGPRRLYFKVPGDATSGLITVVGPGLAGTWTWKKIFTVLSDAMKCSQYIAHPQPFP
jgi:hypothetical protein